MNQETKTADSGPSRIDWVSIKQKTVERLIGVFTMVMVGSFAFWYASFAKDVDVKQNTKKVKHLENEITELGSSLKNTNDEIKDLRYGIKTVLSGMCIMDEKTCSLKEDFNK